MTLFDKNLNWLIELCQHGPAWREYAWSRAKELEAEYPGMKAALTKAVKHEYPSHPGH